MRYFMALAVGLFLPSVVLATPPSVSISSPSGGEGWGPGTGLIAKALASDADGVVSRVEFFIDGSLVYTANSERNGNQFTGYIPGRPTPGTHVLSARAYDNSGEFTDSAPYSLEVSVPPPLPDVTIEEIKAGATRVDINYALTPKSYTVSPQDISVEFGTSPSYGSDTSSIQVVGINYQGTEPIQLSAGLRDLDRNTTYHCRMVIKTWGGESYSEDTTFTTVANLSPYAYNAFGNTNGTEPVLLSVEAGDPDNETVTITAFTQPNHGTVTQSAPRGFIYTPDETFEEFDSFTYTVTDQHGASATGRIDVGDLRKTSPGRYVLTLVDESERRAVGSLGIKVTSSGAFTGVLSYFGVRYPVRGRFSTDGMTLVEIDRKGAPPLTLSLGEQLWDFGVKVGGMLTASGTEIWVTADYALDDPTDAPEKGAYTMALPASDPALPLGNGYVVGRVSSRGRVAFTGKIGDGQAFSFGTQLRRGGTVQIYVTAGAAPRDRIYGSIQFPGSESNESTGELRWYKAPRTSGVYEGGFDTTVQVAGSRLALEPGENDILNYSTELAGIDISFSDLEGDELLEGTLSGLSEKVLTFAAAAPAFGLAERSVQSRVPKVKPAVTFKVNRKNGSFAGTLRNPNEDGKVRKFSGVFLQHQNSGAGLVKFASGAGVVTLNPK